MFSQGGKSSAELNQVISKPGLCYPPRQLKSEQFLREAGRRRSPVGRAD